MLFKDYKKSYIEFCEQEIMREIALAKRRYLRKERFHKQLCTLNNKVDAETEGIDILIGSEDIEIDDILDFNDTIENEKLAKSVKLLTSNEREVVSLRFKEGCTIEEIKVVLGGKSKSAPFKKYKRAMNKIKTNMEENVNEKK